MMLRRCVRWISAAGVLALFNTVPTAVSAVCVGDCGHRGTVTIGNVQACIGIFLNTQPLSICANCDQNGDGTVSISEVQGAIKSFLNIASCLMVTPSATASATATHTVIPNTPTRTPTRTPTHTPIRPTRTATTTPTPGPSLGTRTFLVGSTNSGFFSSLMAGKIGALKAGALLLAAGPLDANGHATVTLANQPVLIQTNVAVGGVSLCTRILSCTGTLYCNGGANVDVSESLDSLQCGLTCVQDGTNHCAASASNVCCSNSCEAAGTGSGNPVVAMSKVNGTDSGPGALLLKCTQIDAQFPYPPGDCGRANFAAYPQIEQLYTTGTSTAEVLHPCAGSGAPPNIIPMIAETGQNFDCSQWTDQNGPGQLVYTIPSEEGSTVIGGAGDDASAAIWRGP